MKLFIKLVIALVGIAAIVLSAGCGGESGEISERELVVAKPMRLSPRCPTESMPSRGEGYEVKGDKIATTLEASGRSSAQFRLETKDLEEQGKYLAIRAEDSSTILMVIIYGEGTSQCYSSGVMGGSTMSSIELQEGTLERGDSIVIVASDSEQQYRAPSAAKPSTSRRQATPSRSTSTATKKVYPNPTSTATPRNGLKR